MEIIGLPNPSILMIMSSIFHGGTYVEEISVQCMRRIAQKLPVYIALIRSVDKTKEDQIVELNEGKARTPFPI